MSLDVAAEISRRSVGGAPRPHQWKRGYRAQGAGERRLRAAQHGSDSVGSRAKRRALVRRSCEDVLAEYERLPMNEQHEYLGVDVACRQTLDQRRVARGTHEAQRGERLGRREAELASEDIDVDVSHRRGVSEDEKLG